jgi:transcriptional regulator with XRE-family HTH domain|tara:strand:- start:102 stop:545 length:444 start_codon:yes stop_codon:yes gene_type:complete
MVDEKSKILKLGKMLKAFRKKVNLTQPELASISGVSTSIVNDLENGIRTAGCNTLNKIAHGLELGNQDRFRLILKGLELSKRDFVIPDFTQFSPEIINFLPYVLAKNGITPEKVKNVELDPGNKGGIQITTSENLNISIEIRLSKKN